MVYLNVSDGGRLGALLIHLDHRLVFYLRDVQARISIISLTSLNHPTEIGPARAEGGVAEPRLQRLPQRVLRLEVELWQLYNHLRIGVKLLDEAAQLVEAVTLKGRLV